MTSSKASHPCINIDNVVPSTPLITFLEHVQETAFTTFGEKDFDPKLYVDFSLKFNLSTTVKAFNELPRSGNGTVLVKDLEKFIATYFDGPSKDVLYYDPPDFVPEPDGFLPKVENQEVRIWALKVHSLWKNLSRKVSDEVEKHPELHTLLPLPAAPVIIPGSRFRELYYWDSYWVIRGLLASKMYETANAIVNNLIFLVNTYGYALNGGRAYYTNRSQPPLLSAMVCDIYKTTGDMELAKRALPALLKEHQFWNSEIHKVTIMDAQGNDHNLSRYYAMWNKPRPEATTKDKKFASKFLNSTQKEQFYRELASTAESGWDFSTRWMRNPSEFTSLATTSILPVDLNVFLLKMELDIVFFAKETGEESIVERFVKASQARKKAINSIFWNDKMGQWLDYWLTDETCQESHKWKACNQSQNVFASNFSPLWIDLLNSDTALVEKVMGSLQSSGLLCAAGIATSLTNSGQQWDFPNGWAHLQHIIVEGLEKSGLQEAKSLAEDIAMRWVRTNYIGYMKTGAMHEKYNVEKWGESGGGGLYVPQTGFGWSNGVVLAFLEEFGWPQDQRIDC
ncbi:trehalase [Ricinus communis]|uniref:trehalase n=1 Tax=Ricinus communis TaxID=3988 RepID=UPI00201A4192|nr:trehalase [Ricinus communis]